MARVQNSLRPVKTRTYLNRDFDSFRAALLQYVRTYFPNNIQDFSDPSVGGMFLDMAAYAGDVSAFYLDHQFRELSVDTAIETQNIQNLLTMAGVKIVGASPAIVDINISITVPATRVAGRYTPNPIFLPKLVAGSAVRSRSGITFEIDQDVDFAATGQSGTLIASVSVLARDASQNPTSYIVTRTATCMSGRMTSESFSIDNSYQAFRRITLSNSNVTEITSVKDTEGNVYYEVEALTQDTVFTSVENTGIDSDEVPYALELVPAPYRFTSRTALGTGNTSLQFGAGDAQSLDNDIIPDPSEVSLPLFGKRQVARVAIDPSSVLRSATLGYAPSGTVMTVRYRHGGGLDHNVPAANIAEFERLNLLFPTTGESTSIARVRASISVTNPAEARGGDNAPTIDELKLRIDGARNAQNRIVSAPDLLSRVYTMPSSFGRVFRAGASPSRTDPAVTNLYVISRNVGDEFTISSDTLKRNLRTYLNQFRLISDNIDILDAQVLNYGVTYTVTVEFDQNRRTVLQSINTRLRTLLTTNKFQVGQPLVVSDIISTIINTPGVSGMMNIRVVPKVGTISGRTYSSSQFEVATQLRNNVIRCPVGAIFEMKYPDYDITGSAQ
jgi:hypothetical protein